MTTPIPTTVFSGFLGSGKTTIILNLVEKLQSQGEQVAYIKNEIGQEDVDATLLRGKHIQTKELINGCICCTLVGPFIDAIDELVATVQPTRILIEASGAADPSAIALMISSQGKLRRDGVITIIDVVNFTGYKDLSFTAREQAKFTDLIVFNKVELVSLAQKRAVVGYVRELNEYAPIIEAPHGRLSPDVVFGLRQEELETILRESNTHSHHHLTDDHIETLRYPCPKQVSLAVLRDHLDALPAAVFRVKGFVMTDNGMQMINKVGHRTTIEALPEGVVKAPEDGVLVYIGFALSSYKQDIHPL